MCLTAFNLSIHTLFFDVLVYSSIMAVEGIEGIDAEEKGAHGEGS